jgi:hypothetical protein
MTNGDELSCDQLWRGMPPRKIAPLFLAADQCVLSKALVSHLQAQQTWMSDPAKFVAVYDKPFWREAGLSGQGFSRVGPMVEINDACADNTSAAALFGFIDVPAYLNSVRCLAKLRYHPPVLTISTGQAVPLYPVSPMCQSLHSMHILIRLDLKLN